MQSEFDKILSKKLSGYQAEYNPADWQKMEAMLPQNSRKPFLLLPLLFLLLGVIGLWSGMSENSGANKPISAEANQATEQRQNETSAGSFENSSLLAEKNVAAAKSTEKNLKTNSTSAADNEIERDVTEAENPAKGKNHNQKSSAPRNSGKKMNTEVKENKSANSSMVLNSSGSANLGVERSRNEEELPLDNSLSADSNTEAGENFAMNLYAGEQIPGAPVSNAPKTSNPKVKKKNPVAEFAIGTGAGINFSLTDAARWTKPGYSVDLNEEVMFLKRIGVSLTQSYTVRKYDGGNYPCPVSGYSGCPNTYSSTVKSFDFGVDAKANLIQKSKWGWYVKAGIVNAIKFREEFEYHYPDYDTIIPPQPTLAPQTNFNGSNTNEALFDNAMTGGVNYVESPDLTISGAKRYHLAWHFATGIDYRISSRAGLQFELAHTFTKPTAGADDKRLHSPGVNGKFCYLFGK